MLLNPKTISKKTCNMHYIGQRIDVDPKLITLIKNINAQNARPESKLTLTFVHRNENKLCTNCVLEAWVAQSA